MEPLKQSRSKPGEGLLKKLAGQEARLKDGLARVEARRQLARDKVTGKAKARGYVKKWLEALSTAELKEEARFRGYRWEVFESIDHAVGVIVACMFEEMTPEEEASLLEGEGDGEEPSLFAGGHDAADHGFSRDVDEEDPFRIEYKGDPSFGDDLAEDNDLDEDED